MICGLFFVKESDGFPQRLPKQTQEIERVIAEGRGNCLAMFDDDHPDYSDECEHHLPDRPSVAVIGDSHASALGPGLRKQASARGSGITILTKSSCGPLLNVPMTKETMPEFSALCSHFMDQAFQHVIIDKTVKTVVLAGAWALYDKMGKDILSSGLNRSIETLERAGKNVLVVGDVPAWKLNPIHLAVANSIPMRFKIARLLSPDKTKLPSNFRVSNDVVSEDTASDYKASLIATSTGASWIDLKPTFCTSSGCKYFDDGKLLYIDQTHLSVPGSDFVSSSLSQAFPTNFH
jgi:hypothetical protein